MSKERKNEINRGESETFAHLRNNNSTLAATAKASTNTHTSKKNGNESAHSSCEHCCTRHIKNIAKNEERTKTATTTTNRVL